MRALVILAILGLIIALVLIFKNHIIHKNIESFRTQNPESQFDTATSYTIIDVLPAYYMAKGVNTFYERVLQSMNPSTPGNSYISFPNNQRTTMYSSATFDGKPNYFKTSTWFSFKRYDTSPDTFALLTQEADRMKQIAEANPILAINIRAELGGNSFYEEDDGYTYWSDSNLDLIRIYMSKAGKRTVYNKIDVIGRITDIAKNEAKQSASVGSILNMSDTSLLDQIMRVKYGDNQPYYSTMMKCKPEFASRVSGSQLIIDPLPNNSRDNDQSCNTPITANLLAIVAFPLRRFLMEVIFSRQTRINQLKGLPAPSKLEPTNYGVNVREKPFLNLLAKSFYSLTNGEKNISYIYDVYSIGSSVVDLRCDIKTHAPGDEINNAYNNLRNTYFNMRFNPFLTEDELDKLTEEYDAKVEALQAAQETNIASTESGALLRVYLEKQGQVFVVTGYSQGLNAVTSFNKWYNGGNEIYDDSTKDAPGLINYTPEIDFDLNKPLLPDFTNEFQLKTFMAEYLDAIEGGISTEVQRVAGADITSKKVAVTEILGSAQINSLQGMIYWKEDHYDQETMKKVTSGVIRVGRFVFMKNVDNWYSNELLLDTSGFIFAESTAGPSFSFIGRYQTPENVGRFITLDGNTKYWQTWGSNEVNPVSACSLCPTGTAYCNSAVNITPGEFSLLTVSSTPFNCDILKGNVSVTPKMLDKPISMIATLPPKETLEDSEGMCPTVRCSDPKLLYNIVDTFNNDPEQAGAILKVIKSVEASPNQCDLQVEIDYSVTKKKDDGSPGATAPAGKSGIMRETRAATLELDIRDCSFNVVEIGEADSGTTVFPNTPELFPIFTFATYSKKEFGDRFASILNPVTNMVTTTFNTVKNLIKDYRLGTVALAADLTTLEGCPQNTCRDPKLYKKVLEAYTAANWTSTRMTKILRVGTVDGTTCDFTFQKDNVSFDIETRKPVLSGSTTSALRIKLRKEGDTCEFNVIGMQPINPAPPYDEIKDLSGALLPVIVNAASKTDVNFENKMSIPFIDCKSLKLLKLVTEDSKEEWAFSGNTITVNGVTRTLNYQPIGPGYFRYTKDFTNIERAKNTSINTCSFWGAVTENMGTPQQAISSRTELREYAFNYNVGNGQYTIVKPANMRPPQPYTKLEFWERNSLGSLYGYSEVNFTRNAGFGLLSSCPAVDYSIKTIEPIMPFSIYDVRKLKEGVAEVRASEADSVPFSQLYKRVKLYHETNCSLGLDIIEDGDPADSVFVYKPDQASTDLSRLVRPEWTKKMGSRDKLYEITEVGRSSQFKVYYKVKRVVFDTNGYITEAYLGQQPYFPLSIVEVEFRPRLSNNTIFIPFINVISAAPTNVTFAPFTDPEKTVAPDPQEAITTYNQYKIIPQFTDTSGTIFKMASLRLFSRGEPLPSDAIEAALSTKGQAYPRPRNATFLGNMPASEIVNIKGCPVDTQNPNNTDRIFIPIGNTRVFVQSTKTFETVPTVFTGCLPPCKAGYVSRQEKDWFMCVPEASTATDLLRDPFLIEDLYENPKIITIDTSTQEILYRLKEPLGKADGYVFTSANTVSQIPTKFKIMASDNGVYWRDIFNGSPPPEVNTPIEWFTYPLISFDSTKSPIAQPQNPNRLRTLAECKVNPVDFTLVTNLVSLTAANLNVSWPGGGRIFIKRISEYAPYLDKNFIIYKIRYYTTWSSVSYVSRVTTESLYDKDEETIVVLFADSQKECGDPNYKVKQFDDLLFVAREFGIDRASIRMTPFTDFANKPADAALPISWGGFKDVTDRFIDIGRVVFMGYMSTDYETFGCDAKLGAAQAISDINSVGYIINPSGESRCPIIKRQNIEALMYKFNRPEALFPNTDRGSLYKFYLRKDKYIFTNQLKLAVTAVRDSTSNTLNIGKLAIYLWNKRIPYTASTITVSDTTTNQPITVSSISNLCDLNNYNDVTFPVSKVLVTITLDKFYLVDSYLLVTALDDKPISNDPVSWTMSMLNRDGSERLIETKTNYLTPTQRFTATPLFFIEKGQPLQTVNDFKVKSLMDCGMSLEDPSALLRYIQTSWFNQNKAAFNDLTNPFNITGLTFNDPTSTAIIQVDSGNNHTTPRTYYNALVGKVFTCDKATTAPITFTQITNPAIPPGPIPRPEGVTTVTYLRWRPLALRGGGTATKVGKVMFLVNQRFLILNTAPTQVKSPAATDSNTILNAVDYTNQQSEWSDSTLGVFYVKFGSPTAVEAFAFLTGSVAAADPIRWYVEGSTDGKIWFRLHDQSVADYATPTDRRSVVGPFMLDPAAQNFTLPNPFTTPSLGACGTDPMSQYITNLIKAKARVDGLSFEPTRVTYSIAENKATYVQETLGMDMIVQFASTGCTHSIVSATAKQSSDLFCASQDFKDVFGAKTGAQILDIKQAGTACDVRISDDDDLPFSQIYKRAFMVKNPTTGKVDINRIDDGDPAVSRFAYRPDPTDQVLADLFRTQWNGRNTKDQIYTIYQSGVDDTTQLIYYRVSRATYDDDGFIDTIFSADFNTFSQFQVEFSKRLADGQVYIKNLKLITGAPISLTPFTDINGSSIADPRKYMPRYRKIRVTFGSPYDATQKLFDITALQFWKDTSIVNLGSVKMSIDREKLMVSKRDFFADTDEYDSRLGRNVTRIIKQGEVIYMISNGGDTRISMFYMLQGEGKGTVGKKILFGYDPLVEAITDSTPVYGDLSYLLNDPMDITDFSTRKSLYCPTAVNGLMIESTSDMPEINSFLIMGGADSKCMPTKMRIEFSGNGKFWKVAYSNMQEPTGFFDPNLYYTGWNISPLISFDKSIPLKSMPPNPAKPKYLVDCGYTGRNYSLIMAVDAYLKSQPVDVFLYNIESFYFLMNKNAFLIKYKGQTVSGSGVRPWDGQIAVVSPIVTNCKDVSLSAKKITYAQYPDSDSISIIGVDLNNLPFVPFGQRVENIPEGASLPEFWRTGIVDYTNLYNNVGTLNFGEWWSDVPSNGILMYRRFGTWKGALECEKDPQCIGFMDRSQGAYAGYDRSYTFRYDPAKTVSQNTTTEFKGQMYLKKTLIMFKFLRLTPLKNRAGTTGGYQLGKVGIYAQNTLLKPYVTSVRNEATGTVTPTSAVTDTPANLMNYTTSQGWRVTNTSDVRVVITFENTVIADGYTIVTTSSGSQDLDPVQWRIEASTDGTNWRIADEVTTDFNVPTTRYTSIGLKYFDKTRESIPVTDFQQRSLTACGLSCTSPSVITDFVNKYQTLVKKTQTGFANPTNITHTAYNEDENTCYFKVDDSTAVGVPSASVGLTYQKPPVCSAALPTSTLSSGLPDGITLAPIKNLSSRFLYIRFRPIALRGGAQAIGPMINKMALYNGTEQLSFTGAAVQISTPTGTDTNTATNVFDYFSKNTNWSDTSMMGLYIKVGAAPIEITGFTFLTGTSSPERDPVRWVLEGSSDGTVWQLLHDQSASDYAVPTDRAKQLPLFTFDPSQPAPTVPSIYEKRISSCGSSCADPTILEMVSKATAASGTFFSPDSYAYDAGANSCLYRQANDGSKLLVTFSTNLICQTTINTITATNTQQGTPTAIPAGTLKGLDDCNQPCDSPDILNSMNTYFTNTLNKPAISAKGGGTDKVNNECLLTLDDNFGEAALQNKPVGVQFRKKTGCTPLEFVRLDTTPTQSLITPTSGITAFKFMRFRPLATRSATSSYVHVSKVKFFVDDATEFVMDSNNTVVTNPQGDGTPANAIGTDTTKKWIDTQKKSLVFAFKEAQTLRGFSWSTAPGTSALDTTAAGGDPVRWKLEGSVNGVFWQTLHDQSASDYAVNTGRLFNLPIFHFDGSAPTARAQPVVVTAPVTYGLKACNILCTHPNVISVMTAYYKINRPGLTTGQTISSINFNRRDTNGDPVWSYDESTNQCNYCFDEILRSSTNSTRTTNNVTYGFRFKPQLTCSTTATNLQVTSMVFNTQSRDISLWNQGSPIEQYLGDTEFAT